MLHQYVDGFIIDLQIVFISNLLTFLRSHLTEGLDCLISGILLELADVRNNIPAVDHFQIVAGIFICLIQNLHLLQRFDGFRNGSNNTLPIRRRLRNHDSGLSRFFQLVDSLSFFISKNDRLPKVILIGLLFCGGIGSNILHKLGEISRIFHYYNSFLNVFLIGLFLFVIAIRVLFLIRDIFIQIDLIDLKIQPMLQNAGFF